MVFYDDLTIAIGCDCGCSGLIFKLKYGNVWVTKMEDAYYNKQTKVSDLIKEHFKNIFDSVMKKEKYLADISLNKDDMGKFIGYLNDMKNYIQNTGTENENSDESSLPSHVHVEHLSDMDYFFVSLRTKFKFKDALLNKVHGYYEPYLSLQDFCKFVDKITKFYVKHGGVFYGQECKAYATKN